MKAAIMQPTYLPWLGYFGLIDLVDKFVFLDDVKLELGSWHVRNRIKTQQGELYLTVPVRRTLSRIDMKINNALINNDKPWRKKHLKSIQQAYSKSKYFKYVYPFITSLYENKYDKLVDFNINIIKSISDKMGINTEFKLASDLKVISEKKDYRLVAICKELECDEYISPQGSAVYINKEKPGGAFADSEVNLYYMNFEHPVYNQLHGKFLPYLSIVDLLLNQGFEESIDIIRSGIKDPIYYKNFSVD